MQEALDRAGSKHVSLHEKSPYPEFSVPHLLAFGLHTEVYRVNLHIDSECGKIRTRKIPNMNTFNADFSNLKCFCFL